MINLIVLISIAVLAILTNYKGSRILLSATIAFYPASMIYAGLPIKENMLFMGTKGVSLFYSHAIIFAIVFAIIFFAVVRITHDHLGYGTNRWINSVLISGSFVLLLLALSFHVLPTYNIFQISNKEIITFWQSDWGYVISLVAPLVAIWRVSKHA